MSALTKNALADGKRQDEAAKPSLISRTLRALAKDDSGLAMTEFAFIAPIFLSLGLMGSVSAYYTILHMQVSQSAMQVADNASRVGEADVLTSKRVFENDINGSLVGAEKAGDVFELFDHGRVIVSSLQQNSDGGQWIAWQRSKGWASPDRMSPQARARR